MTSEPIFRRAGRPPDGAPNIVAIVLDDTGFAQLGCFGSDVATPYMDRLAAGGLRYNRFHVTALCSPTRASFLTGRNHHAIGMGFLADIPLNHHGYTARIPRSAATLPRILRDGGYSTLAVGKWHLTPRFERSAAGPFDHWPLGVGFERYYGFLQGDTNHYAPNLVQDNHYVDPPATPEQGYHLTEDLTDRAIRYLDDQRHAAPGKPFFLYFAPGAMHSPHHVTPEWVEPYHGRFDHGWEAWREETFRRQRAAGVVPPGTTLTPRPDWVPAWDGLGADERRMYARQQEVFAGFLTHTDAQIGRLIDHLAETGRLDNTIVVLFSDNGASAEGGVAGSVNEHRFTAGIRESLADNLAHHDDWGGPRTYNHYGWGWAWAGNTPFRLWKRYTWLGGTRTPLIVHWPAGIRARGQVRDPVVHVNDLFPTLLDAAGVRAPDVVDGIDQQEIDGASLRATFDDPAAPAPRDTQYFEMLGSRSLIHGRWKVTTDHVSTGVLDEEDLLTGSRSFEDDHWALFDLSADFSEATDRAADHPGVVAELRRLWDREAERNHVLPLFDNLVERFGAFIGPAWPAGDDRTYRPGASPVCDESLPMLFGGFRLSAEVEATADPDGVLLALGDWNGGFALFVAEGRLTFTFSRAGEPLEVTADRPVPAGRQSLGVLHTTGPGGSAFHLLHDDTVVGALTFAGLLPVALQHGGAGLRLGHDTGLPVSDRYRIPSSWNGRLLSVRLRTPGSGPIDPRTELRAALHAD
ncbi:arylsulfatase [Actinomadura craniellae]|uniref:Arylsulfatase n=1 Tax=Actinomadura craniellae TaxID=2231787 RepID=A0A365H119_9ACTN|nr:arylsulfatase [Actinomadura craniellae]RAY12739.1 arylsulfatase [Actinomadura craniellae]